MTFFITKFFFDLYEYFTILVPTCIIYFSLKLYIRREKTIIYFLKILLFTVYSWFVIKLTGAGTFYDVGKYDELIRIDEITLEVFASEGMMTYVLNIIMMMPFGFLIPFIWSRIKLKNIFFWSLSFSMVIELSQLLNRRNSAIDDLIMNILGAILGYYAYELVKHLYDSFIKNSKSRCFSIIVKQSEPIIKNEVLLYIIGIFCGYFWLYNWRGYINMFYNYFYY